VVVVVRVEVIVVAIGYPRQRIRRAGARRAVRPSYARVNCAGSDCGAGEAGGVFGVQRPDRDLGSMRGSAARDLEAQLIYRPG
jgi:hypothetical protein